MQISFIENPIVEIQIIHQLQSVPLIAVDSIKTDINVVLYGVVAALKQSRLHVRNRGGYISKDRNCSLKVNFA